MRSFTGIALPVNEVSHEEGTCPNLTPTQREDNRITRLKQKEMEELAAKEAFSLNEGLDKPASREAIRELNHTPNAPRRWPGQNIKGYDHSTVQRSDHGDLRNESLSREIHELKKSGIDWTNSREAGIVPRDRRDITLINANEREHERDKGWIRKL
ncbi:unnamed protein product [Brassica napus]|uniref:(rape) hypothetical protein n=1 Tax=Brassica napus TaxID=3708 RepID=A0A817B5B9_BRANA|nr:unnamed protein product [Brassica napus]